MHDLWKAGLLAAMLMAAAVPAQADEAADKAEIASLKARLDRLESRLDARGAAPAAGASDGGAVVNLPSGLAGVNLSGFVDTTYTYNFNEPETNVNSLRVFDTRSNGFLINNAQVALEKVATSESPVGFKTELMFGTDAEVVGAVTTGLGVDAEEVELQEGYVEYLAPLGNGLGVKVGKFATLHGAEVIEAKDNWNISRSYLFGFAIPFTHTGVRAHYPVSDQLMVMAGVNNGWDIVDDANKAKTVELGFSSTPIEDVTLSSTYMFGAEGQGVGDNGNQRHLLDVVAGWQATPELALKVNYDYGWEDDAGGVLDNAVWQGVAAYARYALTDKAAVSLRAEAFNDADGVRTAINATAINGVVTPKLRMYGLTLTGEYKLHEHLISRLEYRHDTADAAIFSKDDGITEVSHQDTVGVQFIAPF